MNFKDLVAKGGKKDRKAGVELGQANQIAFFSWLNELTDDQIQVLLKHAAQIRLTEFETKNLRNLGWYQTLCRRSQSPENFPDVFHLWTAECNGLDAVLTLDQGLQKLVYSVSRERSRVIEIKTEVLRPLDLLQKLGVSMPDDVTSLFRAS